MQDDADKKTCCCGSESTCCRPTVEATCDCGSDARPAWIVGEVESACGTVPQVSTSLTLFDHLGAWKMRWAIGRMGYLVPPGLYAVGQPTRNSPVLVSANYKMSFDRLRSQLSQVDAWILVLDTQGVNVWCAAGKGTLGTDELIRRIDAAGLHELVSHRTVIVPQLAAPGVAGHEVRKRSGFRVVFGPVDAKDIPQFLQAQMKATPAMRRVQFPFRDRIALVPVELVTTAKWTLSLAVLFLLLAGLGRDGYAVSRLVDIGVPSAAMFLTTCFGSLVLGPALLPWLPGRSFSMKGLWIALALLLVYFGFGWFPAALNRDWSSTLAWCLVLPAAASILVLKFTGASTYTSLSGVRREMRIALPIQLAFTVLGLVLWLVGRFL